MVSHLIGCSNSDTFEDSLEYVLYIYKKYINSRKPMNKRRNRVDIQKQSKDIHKCTRGLNHKITQNIAISSID